jgi:hypothetical protein
LLATSFVLAAVPATTAVGAVFLSKAEARRAAVAVTARTCRAVPWCQGFEVVSARRCSRERPSRVHCAIAFITADRHRCRGLVVVAKSRTGRLARGMAVPMDCSGTAAADRLLGRATDAARRTIRARSRKYGGRAAL